MQMFKTYLIFFFWIALDFSPSFAESRVPKNCGTCRPIARPALDAPAVSARSQLLAETLRREGTVVMSSTQIEARRLANASSQLPNPENFGTCIEFVMQLTSKFNATRHFLGPNAYREINSAVSRELPSSAWKKCTPGGQNRPTPGDIYILTFSDDVFDKDNSGTLRFGKGWFSHIGVFVGREAKVNQTETWLTVDGGDTHAIRVVRFFDTASCVLTGPQSKQSTLHGWIDMDAFAGKVSN